MGTLLFEGPILTINKQLTMTFDSNSYFVS